MRLVIETYDRRLMFDLIAAGTFRAGTIIDAPGGVKLTTLPIMGRKAIGIPEVLEFIVDASVAVDLALFANWLYDKVKDKEVARITFSTSETTEITQDAIRKIVEKELKIERNDK